MMIDLKRIEADARRGMGASSGDTLALVDELELALGEIDRLRQQLDYDGICNADPADTIDGLRLQFSVLKVTSNALAYRLKCVTSERDALAAERADVSAERETNRHLTDCLLASEAERDRLRDQLLEQSCSCDGSLPGDGGEA